MTYRQYKQKKEAQKLATFIMNLGFLIALFGIVLIVICGVNTSTGAQFSEAYRLIGLYFAYPVAFIGTLVGLFGSYRCYKLGC